MTAQKGFAHALILILLLAGLVGGVYLVQQKTNLFSRASSGPILPISGPIGGSVTCVPSTLQELHLATSCPSNGFRKIRYVCNNKTDVREGTSTSCKTTAEWEALAREACNQQSFCPTPTPTKVPTKTPTPKPSPTTIPTPTSKPVSRFVKVVAPNGGQALKVGDQINITWDYADVDTCYLGWSTGPGSLNWINNGTGVPASSKLYVWTVNVGNMLAGSQRSIKIDLTCYKTGVGSVNDQSDSFFTVTK